MTASPDFAQVNGVKPTSTQEVTRLFATDIAAERTRMLYQGSQVPTLFMLLCGVACAFLLRGVLPAPLLVGWSVWWVILAVLRLVQVRSFSRALPSLQAEQRWRQRFLLGSAVSGLTLAFAAIVLVPGNVFFLQALVYGLIAAAILSASVACAISLTAFLSFALPCLVPALAFLLLSDSPLQQGWGLMGSILLVALLVVAWQVNRLVHRSLLQQFQNRALISNLEHAKK